MPFYVHLTRLIYPAYHDIPLYSFHYTIGLKVPSISLTIHEIVIILYKYIHNNTPCQEGHCITKDTIVPKAELLEIKLYSSVVTFFFVHWSLGLEFFVPFMFAPGWNSQYLVAAIIHVLWQKKASSLCLHFAWQMELFDWHAYSCSVLFTDAFSLVI